jgi:hypothetical protein
VFKFSETVCAAIAVPRTDSIALGVKEVSSIKSQTNPVDVPLSASARYVIILLF